MRPSFVIAAALILTGCGVDEPVPSDEPRVGYDAEALAELARIDLGRYLGVHSPARSLESELFTGYEFADPDGPTCLYGRPFYTTVRDVPGDDLLVYLQGGGACWQEQCSATESAAPGIMPLAWTSTDPALNPLAGYDTVFVSYCDGSVFTGDHDLELEGETRHHRGLMNLSAALDVARARFPTPRRVVLAGSSAGGYGTLLGTALVRLVYPTTPLVVFNDAGLGLTNPDDRDVPTLLEAVKRDWRITEQMPPGCAGCAEGRFTSVIDWHLRHDPSLRVGGFSSYGDFVIGGAFLHMEAEAFGDHLLAETELVVRAHPGRFQRYFVSGSGHTAVAGGYSQMETEGVRFTDWIQAALDGGPGFVDVLAPREAK